MTFYTLVKHLIFHLVFTTMTQQSPQSAASAISLESTADYHTDPAAYAMALRYQQRSAEIMALQLQIYRFAQERMHEKLALPDTGRQPAIVLDLDETVLDNSKLLVRDIQHRRDFSHWETWRHWEQQGLPGLIPGAKRFLDEAHRCHVKIFYVSDRTEKNKLSTLNTLNALGLPQADADSVLLNTSSKEERRRSIMMRYQIIMLFGDSLPDFATIFLEPQTTEHQRIRVEEMAHRFGDDWFILPNASYGTWKTATLHAWEVPHEE